MSKVRRYALGRERLFLKEQGEYVLYIDYEELSLVLKEIVELSDSGLMEQSRLEPRLNRARTLLELW